MRIQNGSNNILLDNIESTTSPIVYTRRSRFLDDELDETKDVITSGNCDIPTAISSTNVSMVVPQLSLIDQPMNANQTMLDASVAASVNIPKTTDLFITNAADANLIDHIGTGRHHHRLDKVDNETILSKNVNKTSAQSTELDMHESAFLRRQQLTRVAEWVQNNQLENIEPISSQSSMDAASIDSGYKTKVNNNSIDTKTIALDANSGNCLHNIDNGNIVSDNALSDDRTQIGAQFAQLNNNLINLNEHINGIDRHSSVSLTAIQSDSGFVYANQNAQLDLAQMEYNVKQFLLKQNEWSNSKKASGGEAGEENAGICTDLASDLSLTNKNPHRTETNL